MNNKKESKTNILRIVFVILIIANCAIIFKYSNQNAVESTELSNGTLYKIIKIVSGNASDEKVKEYDPLIRKIAHFSIYTSLGIWCGSLLCTFFENDKNKDKKRITISTIFGFLYACSDEIHQTFVDGRAGRIIDVIIDTIGVANGVLLVLLIIELIRVSSNRNKQ